MINSAGSTRRRLAALTASAATFAVAAVGGTALLASADDGGDAFRPDPTTGTALTIVAPNSAPTIAPTAAPPIGERFARTELYFGTDKPGPDVTDAQFRAFVNRVVTPRFPDGLTTYNALGQFRTADGEIVRERSKVIILLYPADAAGPSSIKIEEIRLRYEKAFEQESVLRADSEDLVSF